MSHRVRKASRSIKVFAWIHFVFFLPPSYFLCFPFDWLNLASRSYTILCPSVIKPGMTVEAITKALLDAMNIEGAFYRLGSNKVVSFPWQTTRAHVIHLKTKMLQNAIIVATTSQLSDFERTRQNEQHSNHWIWLQSNIFSWLSAFLSLTHKSFNFTNFVSSFLSC